MGHGNMNGSDMDGTRRGNGSDTDGTRRGNGRDGDGTQRNGIEGRGREARDGEWEEKGIKQKLIRNIND